MAITRKEMIYWCLTIVVTFFLVAFVPVYVGTRFNKPTRPVGLVKVKIVDSCVAPEGYEWYLLQAEDGQRCWARHYRGKVGDEYYSWPEDIQSYRTASIPSP